MDVFDLRNRLISDYQRYTRSFIKIRDPRISEFVDGILGAEGFWPEPLLQLNPTFRPGGTIDDLVELGILHRECSSIFRIGKSDTDHHGKQLLLHQHQREAILKAREGRSYVLTTGTGSGKSLAYIVPIVDHVLRRGTGRGIQAIVVYPMNALANSQSEELGKFIDRGYPEGQSLVRFARYTGQERGEAREAIRSNPPDILLTNYMMLELLLTRSEDRELVRAAQGIRFLVFDELHTYRGRQGADVAMLIRRCRHAFGNDIICVGTSATMASGGGSGSGSDDRRLEVAKVSQSLFGVDFTPDQIVEETLERATQEIDPADSSVRNAIHAAVDSDNGPPSDYDEFRSHPLASWIESTFGVREEADTGKLLRQVPRRLEGGPIGRPAGDPVGGRQQPAGHRAPGTPGRLNGESAENGQSAAAELSTLADADTERCARILREWLLKGSKLRRSESSRFPIFAFRLHQFLTREIPSGRRSNPGPPAIWRSQSRRPSRGSRTSPSTRSSSAGVAGPSTTACGSSGTSTARYCFPERIAAPTTATAARTHMSICPKTRPGPGPTVPNFSTACPIPSRKPPLEVWSGSVPTPARTFRSRSSWTPGDGWIRTARARRPR